MYRRVLASNEETLGPAHPDTLGTMNSLAVLLSDRAKYEAEPLYRRALAALRRRSGRRIRIRS